MQYFYKAVTLKSVGLNLFGRACKSVAETLLNLQKKLRIYIRE